MTKTSTKTKPARDASGRFAKWHDATKSNLKALNTKKRVGRPRKAVTTDHRTTAKPFNPIGSFGYDDDAVELPSKPYTSPRVERNKAQKAAQVKNKTANLKRQIDVVFLAILIFAVMFLSYLLGATQDWGWR